MLFIFLELRKVFHEHEDQIIAIVTYTDRDSMNENDERHSGDMGELQ